MALKTVRSVMIPYDFRINYLTQESLKLYNFLDLENTFF